MSALEKALEAVPAWCNGAVRVLEQHGEALKIHAPTPRLLLRVGELLLVSGGVSATGDIVQRLTQQSLNPSQRDRLATLAQRTAARRGISFELRSSDSGKSPIAVIRRATVRADIAFYTHKRIRERMQVLREIVEEAEPENEEERFAVDELLFPALVALAECEMSDGNIDEAHELLECAHALTTKYNAPYDQASLLMHRFIVAQYKKDTERSIAVAHEADGLPDDVIGSLPDSLRHQLTAVEWMDRDPVKAIESLDSGLKQAFADKDWSGYASLLQSKYLAFEVLKQGYFAYRTLKLGRSVLRRNDEEYLSSMLAMLEQRLRKTVSAVQWTQFGEQLKSEIAETP